MEVGSDIEPCPAWAVSPPHPVERSTHPVHYNRAGLRIGEGRRRERTAVHGLWAFDASLGQSLSGSAVLSVLTPRLDSLRLWAPRGPRSPCRDAPYREEKEDGVQLGGGR